MVNEKGMIRVIGVKDGNVRWIELTEDGEWIAAGGAGKAVSFHAKVATEKLGDICEDLGIKWFG